MKKLLATCLIFAPAIALASAETAGTASEGTNSARIQIAYAVKRDAEAYLAGAEMTRALRLKLEQLQSEHPDLESDELVERALDQADLIIAEESTAE